MININKNISLIAFFTNALLVKKVCIRLRNPHNFSLNLYTYFHVIGKPHKAPDSSLNFARGPQFVGCCSSNWSFVCRCDPGKIISIETSALRATGRPGWEDLVRKCIYAFFQPQGKEPSHAKKLLHEGEQQQNPLMRLNASYAASLAVNSKAKTITLQMLHQLETDRFRHKIKS